jgi:hypothetical protein
MAIQDTLNTISSLTAQMSGISGAGAMYLGGINDDLLDDLYARLQQAMQQYVIERQPAGPSPPPDI